RDGGVRHARAGRARDVQRVDRVQRHALLLPSPESPDARVRSRRRGLPWRRRAGEGEGAAGERENLRRAADDVRGMKAVVLCSGGMDSVTALYWARREHELVAALSFDYGAKHNAREIPFAAEHAARCGVRHEVIRLDFVNRLFASDLLQSGGAIPEGHYEAENMRRTVVPFRNAIMLSIACGFAESIGAAAVAIAAH